MTIKLESDRTMSFTERFGLQREKLLGSDGTRQYADKDIVTPLPERRQSDFDILNKTTVVEEARVVDSEDTLVTHGIVKEGRVDILFEIERPTDQYDIRSIAERRIVRVKVYSVAKPLLNSSTCISVKGRSQAEMARACEFAAAALAERQCGLYNDHHDPVEFAKLGRKRFNELCVHLARTGDA